MHTVLEWNVISLSFEKKNEQEIKKNRTKKRREEKTEESHTSHIQFVWMMSDVLMFEACIYYIVLLSMFVYSMARHGMHA